MATCRDVIFRAVRMTGVVGREDDPTAAELRDGLFVLQSLYSTWLAGGMFGRLVDVFSQGDYEANEGERVTVDDGTITVPTTIEDDGDSRAPREYAAIVVVTSAGETQYLFSGGQWQALGSLTENDDAPLANLGMNGLAACLAVAYADEFGAQVGPGVLMQCRNFKTALSYKFGNERPVYAGTWF